MDCVVTDDDKTWIKEVFQLQLQQELQRYRQEERLWVREQLDEHSRIFSDRLEKVETTLLTEFHK